MYEYTYELRVGAMVISGCFVGAQPMTETEVLAAVADELLAG